MTDELRDLTVYPVAQDEGGRSDPYIRDTDLLGRPCPACQHSTALCICERMED